MPPFLFKQTADGEVGLRPREREDTEFYRRNVNDPDVRRLLRNVDPKNSHVVEAEFEQYSGQSEDGEEGHGFVICAATEEADGADADDSDVAEGPTTPVGSIGIWSIDHINGTAWMGAWVDPDYHGRGYAPRGAALVVDFAFEELNLNRVQTGVYEPNCASQRVMEKLGFEREGIARQAIFVDGEFVDSYQYGLLREEWDGDEWL